MGLPRIPKKANAGENKEPEQQEDTPEVSRPPQNARGASASTFRGKNWRGNRGRRQRQRHDPNRDKAEAQNRNDTRNLGKASESKVTPPNAPLGPKPAMSLLGAKSVMQQKLSAMYRGMRGLEAAHAAFAMCQVNIAVDVEESKPEVPAAWGKRNRGGHSNQRGRKFTRHARGNFNNRSRVETATSPEEAVTTDVDEGETSGK